MTTTTTTTTRAARIAALDVAARRLRYRIVNRHGRGQGEAWLAEARRRLHRVLYERAKLMCEEDEG
jgi:hypothetical protein